MAVSAADIAPKAFGSLVAEGGEHQDVEDDLEVGGRGCQGGEEVLALGVQWKQITTPRVCTRSVCGFV